MNWLCTRLQPIADLFYEALVLGIAAYGKSSLYSYMMIPEHYLST
jgi:hypothetical protein